MGADEANGCTAACPRGPTGAAARPCARIQPYHRYQGKILPFSCTSSSILQSVLSLQAPEDVPAPHRRTQTRAPPPQPRRDTTARRPPRQPDRPTFSWALVPLLAEVYHIHHANIPRVTDIVNAGLTDDEYNALNPIVRNLFGDDLQANYGPDNDRWTNIINIMRASAGGLQLDWRVLRNGRQYVQDTEQERAMVYFEQRGAPIAFLQALFEHYFNLHPDVA